MLGVNDGADKTGVVTVANYNNNGQDWMTFDNSSGMKNKKVIISFDSNDIVAFKGQGWQDTGDYKGKGHLYKDNNGNQVLVVATPGNLQLNTSVAAEQLVLGNGGWIYRTVQSNAWLKPGVMKDSGNQTDLVVTLENGAKLTLQKSDTDKWTYKEATTVTDPNDSSKQISAGLYTDAAGENVAVVGNQNDVIVEE